MNVYRFVFPFVFLFAGCAFDDLAVFDVPDLARDAAVIDMAAVNDLATRPDATDARPVDLANVDMATRCNNNGAQDDKETGIDCGGPDCGKCAGAVCLVADDCASRSCTQFVCGPWISLQNNADHVLHAMPYNGQPGNMYTIAKSGKQQFADQVLQLVAYARYDNDKESDADGSEVQCISDKTQVPYAPERIAIAALPVYACRYK